MLCFSFFFVSTFSCDFYRSFLLIRWWCTIYIFKYIYWQSLTISTTTKKKSLSYSWDFISRNNYNTYVHSIITFLLFILIDFKWNLMFVYYQFFLCFHFVWIKLLNLFTPRLFFLIELSKKKNFVSLTRECFFVYFFFF